MPPSKLSPEVAERIATLIRAGNTIEISASASGIHRDTFYDWMHRGEAGSGPHAEFREQVLKAQSEAEATLVARIAKAASNGSWGAAAWLLERRAPERWAKPGDRSKFADSEAPQGDSFDQLDELAPRREHRTQAS